MGRVVTRATSRKSSQRKDSEDSSNSSLHLKSAESGRVEKRTKRKRMTSVPSKDCTKSKVDESLLSLSLDDSALSDSALNDTLSSSSSSSPEQSTSLGKPSCSQQPGSSAASAAPASSAPDEDRPDEDRPDKECSICLNKPLQPVKLPCSHIFCYLCIKGVVQSSVGTCALCRSPIPRSFIFSPEVVEESSQSEGEAEEEEEERHTWFYEGRSGGWWEFDPRTAQDIESKYSEDSDEPKVLELLIAGLIFVIDIDAMVQKRKNAPHIQRRLKRDVKHISDKIGVAGISSKKHPRRPQRDGPDHRREGTPV